tara:strand:+ start:182 stop:631 length:450 start_codon:yes stop_codon:yes gene_type:complete
MSFETLSENINLTGEKTQEYINSTAEYYKLRLFKSTMKFATSLTNMLALGSMLMLFLAFFSIGCALWIGTALDNTQAGFFIVGGFFFLVFVFILIFGKEFITKTMLEKFSELILDEGEDLEKDPFYFEDDMKAENILEDEPEILTERHG